MWDHSSQVTTEGLNRPCLAAVVFTPSPPVGAGWCLGIFRRSDGHRPVNTRRQSMLRQRRAVTRRCRIVTCLGGWVEAHLVSEVFELGDESSGVGFVAASSVPVGARVVVLFAASRWCSASGVSAG